VALVAGTGIVEEKPLYSDEGYGHIIFSEIDALLRRHGWRLSDLDCFAAASGPGSFTGTRVGLAAVKGLAAALGRPAVGVSNLQAMAWHGTAPLRAVVADARRGEVYGAVYTATLDIAQPETVTGVQEWLQGLPSGRLELLATDTGWLEEALLRAGGTPPLRAVPGQLAGAVGAVAAHRLERGIPADPAALDANYVRRSDAELFWRDW
jgi:tRNA threonylcarbamoyladenosine biosynthesis protein TsaB